MLQGTRADLAELSAKLRKLTREELLYVAGVAFAACILAAAAAAVHVGVAG